MNTLPPTSFSSVVLQGKLLNSTLLPIFSIKPVLHAHFTIQRSPLNMNLTCFPAKWVTFRKAAAFRHRLFSVLHTELDLKVQQEYQNIKIPTRIKYTITSVIFLLIDAEKLGIFQRLGGFPNRRIRLCSAILEPARTHGSCNPSSATVRLSLGYPVCSKLIDNLRVQYPLLPSQVKQFSNRFSKFIASLYLQKKKNVPSNL